MMRWTAPTKGFLPYRADELRPIVALVTRDVLFLETEVDVLEHGVTGNQHGIKVFEPVLKIRFKISAVCGDTLFQNGGCTLLKTGAQVKCLAFRKVRLSVITDFLKQFSFRKLPVFLHKSLDFSVFRLFGFHPLDGVVQEVNRQRDDVIIRH